MSPSSDPKKTAKKAVKRTTKKAATKPEGLDLKVGDVLHGYQSGVFGGESWSCRRVEGVGADWVVTRILRPTMGQATVEFAHGGRARLLTPDQARDCFCEGSE